MEEKIKDYYSNKFNESVRHEDMFGLLQAQIRN